MSLKGSGRKLLMGLKLSEFKRLNDIMTLCSINSLNGYEFSFNQDLNQRKHSSLELETIPHPPTSGVWILSNSFTFMHSLIHIMFHIFKLV